MIVGYPRHFASEAPDRTAAIMHPGGEKLTYAELEAQANRFAQYLRACGLRPGDRVAFCLENRLEVFPFVWGAQRAGMLYVAVSNKFTFEEVEFILRDSGASVFLSSCHSGNDVAERTARAFADDVHLLGLGDMPDGWLDWHDVIGTYPAEPIADECFGSDMMYSSGTTGRPKGIFAEIDPSKPVDEWPIMATLGHNLFGIDDTSIYFSPAPLYHAAPLRWCMGVQFLGGTVVVLKNFDAEETLRAIEAHKITHAQFVPTHFSRLLELPPEIRNAYDLSTLASVAHAAAPCPEQVKRAMIDWWGPIIDEYYSGSEGAGMTFINSADWLSHPGSVGKAVVGTLRICDESGDPLPVGEVGGVYFEDGRSFAYHQDEEKTAESKNHHGWATMGDVGRIDEEGYLYLTDRKSFLIISGGVNVYPQEIENHLISHPIVRDVAVIGTPDKDFGEKVTAVVELHDPSHAGDETADMLTQFTRDKLSGVKVPKAFHFQEALPRTDTGKLLKRVLVEEFRSKGN